MQTVRIRKQDFLDRVRSNRSAHRGQFEQALEGYERRMLAELRRRIEDLQHGRRIDHYIALEEPQDHTDDYDRVLLMAEMSVEDTLTLSETDFGRYVLDQWDWKRNFDETVASYTRSERLRPIARTR